MSMQKLSHFNGGEGIFTWNFRNMGITYPYIRGFFPIENNIFIFPLQKSICGAMCLLQVSLWDISHEDPSTTNVLLINKKTNNLYISFIGLDEQTL